MLKNLLYFIPCIFFNLSLSIFATPLPATQENENLMQKEIEHVVVIMLENRSFDNVLAWLYSQNDPPSCFIPYQTNSPYRGLSEETLNQYINTLTNSAGEIVLSSPPIKGIPSVAGTPYKNSPKYDPFETFPHVVTQIFGKGIQSTMSGFLQDYATHWWEPEWPSQKQNICAVMETYTSQDIPVLYGLARQYAVSDLWFSSVPTQTNPNRAFSLCGTSEGQIVNGTLGKSNFQSDTIWNRLFEQSPETTWAIFWQTDTFPEIIPGSYCKNMFAGLSRIPNCDSHLQKLDRFHELARNGQLPAFSFIEPQWTLSIDLDPRVKLLDSCLIGLQGNDLHPPGDVRTGEDLLVNIYTSLCANQEAWNKTLFIVLFDEHGGLFDHVPPPAALAPDDQFQNGFKFDRYGVRVPALFISPRVKKGTVIRSGNETLPFDHTSLIATLLKWKKINKTQWKMGQRVNSAPTFEDVITETAPRQDHILVSDPNYLIPVHAQETVQIGEPFYLRNKNGNYLAKSKSDLSSDAYMGSIEDRVTLQLVGGKGKVTHGSFILIQSNDPTLGENNILGTSLSHWDCFYANNQHTSGQWWTIKSVDQPYVGADIHFGDKVYIENHIYLDPLQQIPARLTQREGLLSDFLMTEAITEEGSDDNYWIIEKP